MIALDDIAPNFKRTTALWAEARGLQKHYGALAAKYEGNDHGLIETVKSFVECVCVTVLAEHGKPMPSTTPTTTELLVECLSTLGLKNSPGAGEVGAILKAHNKLADSLSKVRNTAGPIAHGKDGFAETLCSNQSRIFLLTCDALLGLLLAAHEGTEPSLEHTREPYERFTHLHDRIDRSVTFVDAVVEDTEAEQVLVVRLSAGQKEDAKEFRIVPSEFLYSVDRTAYIGMLKDVEIVTAAPTVEQSPPDIAAAISTPRIDEPPVVESSSTYSGSFAAMRESLTQYLGTLGVDSFSADSEQRTLVDSLLSTIEANHGADWIVRSGLQSKTKVAFRRLVTAFGLSKPDADRVSDHLVTWLRIQLGGSSQPVGEGGE